jgi:hypothetical protein
MNIDYQRRVIIISLYKSRATGIIHRSLKMEKINKVDYCCTVLAKFKKKLRDANIISLKFRVIMVIKQRELKPVTSKSPTIITRKLCVSSLFPKKSKVSSNNFRFSVREKITVSNEQVKTTKKWLFHSIHILHKILNLTFVYMSEL